MEQRALFVTLFVASLIKESREGCRQDRKDFSDKWAIPNLICLFTLTSDLL
jgi:hypothetical protein